MLSDNFMLVEKIESDQGRIQTVLSKDYSSNSDFGAGMSLELAD